MRIVMQGKRLGVEKLGKSSGTKSFLSVPEDVSAVGIIRYLGEELLRAPQQRFVVGMKVYYGKNRHELRINGQDILIMDEDNIYAIVEESNETQSGTPA